MNAIDGLLHGLRVIIVEDEPVLQMALDDMLSGFGCAIAGRAARVGHAHDLVGQAAFDLAVLDINLGGDRVDSVAHALAERGVPFIFATGYGEDGIAAPLRNRPVVHKPYTEGELREAMESAWRSHIGRH